MKKGDSSYGSFLARIFLSCTVVIVQFPYLVFTICSPDSALGKPCRSSFKSEFRTDKFVRLNMPFISFVSAIING